MLENTRFEAGDVRDAPALAAELAALCDAYVLDGFGVCHRAQASVSGIARCLPSGCRFPGPLVRRELRFLGAALDEPARPFAVVLGGMKARCPCYDTNTSLRNLRLLLGCSPADTNKAQTAHRCATRSASSTR